MTGHLRRQKKPESSLLIDAPAKLNLRLDVEGRRSDGYHLLKMVNVTLDLCDKLQIERTESLDVSLTVSGVGSSELEELSGVEKNLASRAATLFLKEFGIRRGLGISLEKRIPARAGLGGGSSDAAAVLRGAKELFATELSGVNDVDDRVQALALKLGADVPFFLQGGLCLVEGVGEKVTPLNGEALHGFPCLLLLPPFGCETSAVYATWDRLNVQSRSGDGRGLIGRGSPLTARDLGGILSNDLQVSACELQPELGEIFREARSIESLIFSVTGSGSCVFGLPIKDGLWPEADARALDALAAKWSLRVLKCRFVCS